MEREREKMMHQNFQSFGTPWEVGASSSSGCVFSVGLSEYRTSKGEGEVGGSMTGWASAHKKRTG
jgi:hypothetical protein